MYRKKTLKKLIWGVTLNVLIFAVGFPYQIVMSEELIPNKLNKIDDASNSIKTDKEGMETPKELTDEEFQREMEEIKKVPAGHIVLYDLYDPEGIDPNLLPASIAAQVDGDTKIVEYFETTRIDSVKHFDDFELCNPDDQYSLAGISCASPDGTIYYQTDKLFGSVTQCIKVKAYHYDNAP